MVSISVSSDIKNQQVHKVNFPVLAIMLRTQLNILAGYLYQQQVDHGGEPVATDNNNTGDKHKTFTIKLQQTYLDVCTHFVSSGSNFLFPPRYDGMPYLMPEIVYPFNRQCSMSAAKVCWVNSVACN